MKKRFMVLSLIGILSVLSVTGCGSTAQAQNENIDYSSMTVDQITAGAQKEGELNSVGMPDTWANWIGTWTDIKDKYGIISYRTNKLLEN